MYTKTDYIKKVDFGDESADDAPIEELMAYFVKQDSFNPFIDFSRRFAIVKSRKGNGKSAILQWIYHSATKSNEDIVIKCRGTELARSRFKLPALEDKDPNTLIYDWMSRICTLINRELAKKIKFAFSDQQMSIVETAELDGFKQRNIIGALLERFQLKMSFHDSSIQYHSTNISNEIETLKREKNLKAIIIIDDLDATFQNTPQECLNLSTFFSACRYLVQDFPGIVIRASIRTDVWPLIRPMDESLDKVEQYIFDISWTEHDFVQLLGKRISYSLGIKSKPQDAINMIFPSTLRWGQKEVNNYVCLYTLSYERPRWGIQLCKLSKKIAQQKDHHIITQDDIESAWVDYGKLRIADLESEHKHQCNKIMDMVNAFRGHKSRLRREDLLTIISDNISSRGSVCIDGKETRSAIDIAYFLYRIGFIVARTSDANNYYHYSFEDFSSLLGNKFQKDSEFLWEIHPCYRKALDIKSLNATVKEHTPRMPR